MCHFSWRIDVRSQFRSVSWSVQLFGVIFCIIFILNCYFVLTSTRMIVYVEMIKYFSLVSDE